MSLASRLSDLFHQAGVPTSNQSLLLQDASNSQRTPDAKTTDTHRNPGTLRSSSRWPSSADSTDITAVSQTMDDEMSRSPYLHCMLAGGLGGTTGDMLMHSLDTVKTRQQGDPHMPPKYSNMSSSYAKILREEGIRRGLYGGVTPAFLGSFPGTVIFFGTYEWSKRGLLDLGLNPTLSFLSAGFIADFAASFVYVPSEVLKTRLQLQGRYNNPHFRSGYNYRSTIDAVRTIIRQEGFSALFHGYKATIGRDLPFSALQFAFYERAQQLAKSYVGEPHPIGMPLEVITAGSAGGLAGLLTCPLDVVKTRIQTQINPSTGASGTALQSPPGATAAVPPLRTGSTSTPRETGPRMIPSDVRHISTSSPSGLSMQKGAPPLNTSSIWTGLKLIYKTEGIAGWFRGVGPRLVWTSLQSGVMLVMYQVVLRQLDLNFGEDANLEAL